MKRELCVVCSKTRGKRVCMINNGSLICPVCCAKTRSPICEGCVYYVQAEKYSRETIRRQRPGEFIIASDANVNERVDRALAMAERGNVGAAEKIISPLLSTNADSDMVQYGMGVICLMKGQFEKAIPRFNRAVEINPYFAEAWFNKGAAHQKRLEVGDMIKAFRKVLELGDSSEEYFKQAKNIISSLENQIRRDNGLSLDEYLALMDVFQDAFAAMEAREWEKALAGFRKVISKDPKHVQSHGNMGICYAHLGKKQEALAALDKALEIDPGYKPAITNRKAILSLPEGQRVVADKYISIDYYKDITIQKNS
jgi:tetratricopeptide (TPR) repeat protein